jgi:hypothetical protein
VKPGPNMSELADASGVSAATIKHDVREGLLGRDGAMRSGREPLRDLIGVMHSTLLPAEFQRRR